jgi:hypothetical protein
MELSARENERQTQDMKEVEPVDAGRFTEVTTWFKLPKSWNTQHGRETSGVSQSPKLSIPINPHTEEVFGIDLNSLNIPQTISSRRPSV